MYSSTASDTGPSIDAPITVFQGPQCLIMPDTCSLVVTVDKSSGKAVKLKGNDKHPITKGFLCNKVNHYLDLVYNKNRVLYPHVRIGPKGSKGKFKKVTWDYA